MSTTTRKPFAIAYERWATSNDKPQSVRGLGESQMKRRIGFGHRRRDDPQPVVVVSGLPRSGTSLMMKMLEAAGIPPLTDGIREADVDNPKGYYELERAKKLSSGDTDWLVDAQGKAVKIIATLLRDLPDSLHYRVIFMRRNMPEILASQKQMLVNRGEDPDLVPDSEMTRVFEGHLDRLKSWLSSRSDIEVIEIDYNDLVGGSALEHANRINGFLGQGLDVEAMVDVVDPDLYRQRRQA